MEQKAVFINKMGNVARDIINFNPKRKDLTLSQAFKIFYSIMRKHGIKQGTWHKQKNGITSLTCSNPEWTMCLYLFLHCHNSNHSLQIAFGFNVPKDLEAYGKKPKTDWAKFNKSITANKKA